MGPKIIRIPILPFGMVNAHLIITEAGCILVDAGLAAEFVRLKVNVIVTAGASVVAAKQATSVIPIVFAVAADPLGTGLVASLARPGGNVTGLSVQFTDTTSKRLELLRAVVPMLRIL